MSGSEYALCRKQQPGWIAATLVCFDLVPDRFWVDLLFPYDFSQCVDNKIKVFFYVVFFHFCFFLYRSYSTSTSGM